jgi:hypothetical protein
MISASFLPLLTASCAVLGGFRNYLSGDDAPLSLYLCEIDALAPPRLSCASGVSLFSA